jgi:hypothetical protein
VDELSGPWPILRGRTRTGLKSQEATEDVRDGDGSMVPYGTSERKERKVRLDLVGVDKGSTRHLMIAISS